MKEVHISGITGTLGRAVAKKFERWAWRVAGFSSTIPLTKLPEYVHGNIDVRFEQSVNRWFAGTRAIDAFVTCAGISDVVSIGKQPLSSWEDVIKVNLTGTWLCIKGAVACGATRIVTIASIHGGTPTSYPNRAAYTASKAGVVGLTRALAVELAPRGVAVNCVAPGHLPALMPGTSSGQELLDAAAARTPAGRLVTPEEVADVVYWLCDGAPVTMVGQVLTVSGGYELNTWPM